MNICTLDSSDFRSDQIHTVKLPGVGSVLSSIHALDPYANVVFGIFLTTFCGMSDVNESLGSSLEMCSADVEVSRLHWFPFVRPTLV